jgi:hypothetical protein
MSLVIQKESTNLFSLTLDGGLPIKSEENRLTTIGNVCNFKSGNGANLILKQNILVTDITLISDGTFTFTNTNDLFIKLFAVGFLKFGGSTGGVVDRFDELGDTFSYLGRDGQIVFVNESQLKLDTKVVSVFTPQDKTKLDGIQAEAEKNVQSDWNESDPTNDAFILNKPTISSYFSGIYIGYFIADGLTNTITLPIGVQVLEVRLDRGFIREWTQVNESLTITLALMNSGTDIDITGMQA